mmetsp:Transcript_28931/g.87515  ORF Transcript_28931/g.87515 Transcript_28931/m.87515 type:complete len:323 (+) Transcript_28931:439-1407(+)
MVSLFPRMKPERKTQPLPICARRRRRLDGPYVHGGAFRAPSISATNASCWLRRGRRLQPVVAGPRLLGPLGRLEPRVQLLVQRPQPRLGRVDVLEQRLNPRDGGFPGRAVLRRKVVKAIERKHVFEEVLAEVPSSLAGLVHRLQLRAQGLHLAILRQLVLRQMRDRALKVVHRLHSFVDVFFDSLHAQGCRDLGPRARDGRALAGLRRILIGGVRRVRTVGHGRRRGVRRLLRRRGHLGLGRRGQQRLCLLGDALEALREQQPVRHRGEVPARGGRRQDRLDLCGGGLERRPQCDAGVLHKAGRMLQLGGAMHVQELLELPA